MILLKSAPLKHLYLYTIIFIFSGLIYPQKIYYPVYHYESENGLVHLNVISIQQHNNILYFTTPGGIYQYEGNEFQKIPYIQNLKSIRNIFFNDTATFLIHRDKGLYVYQNNHIYPYFKNNPFKKPSDKIFLTQQYCYNYTDQISLEIYDIKNHIYYNDSVLLNNHSNQAFAVQKLKNFLLVGRRLGLYCIDKNKTSLIQSTANYPIYSIFHLTDKKELYLGSSGKIIVMDDSLFQIKKILPININIPSKSNQFISSLERNISKIAIDKYNRIWFVTQPDDNFYLYDNNQIYDALEILNIPPTLINDLFADNYNNIWVATFNDGVYQIHSTHWQSFKINDFQKSLNILQIEMLGKGFFAATNNGLFYSDTSDIKKIKSIISPDNFFNTEISCLQKYNHKLFAADISAFEKKSFNDAYLNNIIVLPFKYIGIINNTLCYVSDITNNVFLYNLYTQKITDTIFQPTDYKLNIHSLNYIKQKLFISTNKGLYVYDDASKKTNVYLKDTEVQKTLMDNETIYILSANKIYTFPDLKLQMDAEPYKIITISNMQKYKNYIFISSEEGLLLADKAFKVINVIGRKNGLISNVVNDVICINNKLIAATDKGISYTNISDLLNYQMEIYPPSISKIIADQDTIYKTQQQLSFHQNTQNIYFYLSCPNYNPLTKTSYEYSLNNSEWVTFENTVFHLSSLKGGTYTLKIRATQDKVHYTTPLTIKFKKDLNIHERKWFWWITSMITIFLIFIIISFIRLLERKKNAQKLQAIQQINLLKHQAMNAILSPHFIFNSLTGIQNYILQNDVDKASDYLSKFSRLIRMIIEKASHPDILLSDELKRLQFYLELEKERFHDKFDFNIKIDHRIDVEKIHIPNMIIQPYLENAILHGILPKKEKGHIDLSFQITSNNFLEIIIEDDGIGIIKATEKKNKHHKSLATQTIQEILNINTQLYHKKQSVEIIDKSTLQIPSNGTIIKINIEL